MIVCKKRTWQPIESSKSWVQTLKMSAKVSYRKCLLFRNTVIREHCHIQFEFNFTLADNCLSTKKIWICHAETDTETPAFKTKSALLGCRVHWGKRKGKSLRNLQLNSSNDKRAVLHDTGTKTEQEQKRTWERCWQETAQHGVQRTTWGTTNQGSDSYPNSFLSTSPLLLTCLLFSHSNTLTDPSHKI